ncbi:hypothetical protein M3Y97_00211300 [Aphelenchoides bicaudatus]|nr:hypothetical protein M3Y97_00211300 [Aphelenchoides bicaudatus]
MLAVNWDSEMMLGIIVLALLVHQTNACAPGGGKITSTPKFTLNFMPPVSWTYSNDSAATTAGQWSTQADAQRTFKNDITSAISSAVKKNGYEGLLGSAKYTLSGYNAEKPFPIGSDPGQYAVEFGCVTKLILATITTPTTTTTKAARRKRMVEHILAPNTNAADNIQQIQVAVSNSPLALSTDQWSKLASDVYTILNIRSKVRFSGDITVSE